MGIEYQRGVFVFIEKASRGLWLCFIFTMATMTTCLAVNRVFLLGGQSNMKGQGYNGQLPSPYRAAQTNLAFWHDGGWVDLAPGFGNDPGRFGPEVTSGYTVQQAMPSDRIKETGDQGVNPESEESYDSDMAYCLTQFEKRKDAESMKLYKTNISIMKKWAAEGK